MHRSGERRGPLPNSPTDGHILRGEGNFFLRLGREVATIASGYRPEGTYTTSLDGSGLSSGVHFYGLQSGPFVSTKNMVLAR